MVGNNYKISREVIPELILWSVKETSPWTLLIPWNLHFSLLTRGLTLNVFLGQETALKSHGPQVVVGRRGNKDESIQDLGSCLAASSIKIHHCDFLPCGALITALVSKAGFSQYQRQKCS